MRLISIERNIYRIPNKLYERLSKLSLTSMINEVENKKRFSLLEYIEDNFKPIMEVSCLFNY